LGVAAAPLGAAEISGLKRGTPQLKSAGPLAFGPRGVLLVGDAKAAKVVAIATEDEARDTDDIKLQVQDLAGQLAKLLGGEASDIRVNDLAVNPESGNVYLSVHKGNSPALVRVSPDGSLSRMSLDNVAYSQATLKDAPPDKEVEGRRGRRRNPRSQSITDLAWVDGQILVSGLSNAESPSAVRALAFPPSDADRGTSLEIFHGAHGRVEDYAAIGTFVPFAIGGEPHLLAAYTCTPLVKVPVASLVPGEKVRGTTVAELGNRNRPLDMIVYKRDGQEFLLLANSARGVMKVSTEKIGDREPITERVGGGGTAGQPYETVKQLEGVEQLDKLSDTHAVVVQRSEDGKLHLNTVPLP
jgi:hypothetical protein